LADAKIEEFAEQVRKTQAIAIERTWHVDWTLLTAYRRQAEDARAAGKTRSALRALGEATALLATAGRLHKKAGGAASVS
jgi:hypothetical protein